MTSALDPEQSGPVEHGPTKKKPALLYNLELTTLELVALKRLLRKVHEGWHNGLTEAEERIQAKCQRLMDGK